MVKSYALFSIFFDIYWFSGAHSFIHFFKINNDKMHCCDIKDTPSKIRINSHIVIKVQ